jgi:hypothetical protein
MRRGSFTSRLMLNLGENSKVYYSSVLVLVSEVRPSDAARDFAGGSWEYVRP